jgi:hypothetical protein
VASMRRSHPSSWRRCRMGQESEREEMLRQPTSDSVLSDDVERFTLVKPSQLSRVRQLSFGQPPPSPKTLHTESVNDSHSVRSTSWSHGHCNAMLTSPVCCLNCNFSRLLEVISMRLRAGQEVRFIAISEGLRSVSSTNLQKIRHHSV